MAKGKIFIGEIMGGMVEALSEMETAMETSTVQQLAKIDEQIEELQTVNTTIGHAMSAINTKYGDDNRIVFTHGAATRTSDAWLPFLTIKSFANGTFKFRCRVQCSSSGISYIGYSINGGNVVSIAQTSSTTYTDVIGSVACEFGDIITFNIRSYGSTWTAYLEANSSYIEYEMKNLVNEGAFAKV